MPLAIGIGVGTAFAQDKGGGVAPPDPLTYLPTVASAPTFAVGTRKLVNGYNGPAIRIQKSLGDATQTDINFLANGLLDTAAILAFTGASTVDGTLVAQAYDQQGGSNHLTQPTASLMPLLATDPDGQAGFYFSKDTTGSYFIPPTLATNTQTTSVFFLGNYYSGTILQYGTTSLGLQGSTVDGGKLALGTSASRTSTIPPYQNASVIGMVSSASALKISQDDTVAQTASAATSNVITTGRIGNNTSASLVMTGIMQALVLYPAALSDADALSIRTAMKAMRTITARTKNLVMGEDSQTAGVGATFQKERVHYALKDATIKTNVNVYMCAKGGRALDVALSDYPTDVAIRYSAGASKNVYALLGGTNDAVNGDSGATIESDYKNLRNAAVATGYDVVAYNLPLGSATARVDFNNLLDANWPTYASAKIDMRNSLAAPEIFNADHPNSLGYAIWSAIELPTLKTRLGL
jgi:hypothetical protein